jgi:hypothetical protein
MLAGNSGFACGMEVTLNAKFLHLSRFPSLNNKAIILVVFNDIEK